jgi:hypothetical protein
LGIIANATAFAGAFLPAESARRVFGSGVPIIISAVQPRNSTAEPVDCGYLVNGRRWYGSGIHFGDWVLALVPGQSRPAGLRLAVLLRRARGSRSRRRYDPKKHGEYWRGKSSLAYACALAELREDTQQWWADQLAWTPDDYDEDEVPFAADAENLKRFLETEILPWHDKRRRELHYGR